MIGTQAQGARHFPEGRRLQKVLAVGGASRMPAVLRLMRAVTGAKVFTELNPLTVVAQGAAVQAGILDGHMEGFEVMTSLQVAMLRALAKEKQRSEGGVVELEYDEELEEDEDEEDAEVDALMKAAMELEK